MWLFHLTVRWQRHVDPATQALLAAGTPVILCLWHGRMFFLSGGWAKPPRRLGVLTSAHRDGQLVARGARSFGYEPILGSSSRRCAPALRGHRTEDGWAGSGWVRSSIRRCVAFHKKK